MAVDGIYIYVDSVAENGRNHVVIKYQVDDSVVLWRVSRLTRDGTAELVSRDQVLRRERGQG